MKKLAIWMGALAVLVSTPLYANTEAVSELNDLLKGELSAVQTYKQAMEKVQGQDLSKALSQHQDAVKDLQAQIKNLGGTPSTDSGVWGTWAQALTGTAKVLGPETALRALKEGEEHGVNEYEEALKDEDVPANVKQMIREKLLPNQKQHIASLNQMIDKI